MKSVLLPWMKIFVRPSTSSSSLRTGITHLFTVSENEISLVAAEDGAKKRGGIPGKKSIPERILAVRDKLYERQLPPELRRSGDCGIRSSDPSRLEADIINVAEQRIAQSMLRGDFENLPGKGKPLKFESNPHADPAEDLAYRILAKNGFAPEWVELNKEIGFKIRRWRKALDLAWQRKMETSSTGGEVEAEADDMQWESLIPKFEVELQEINKKVLKYNLLVPFGRQLMCYKLERELQMLQETARNGDTAS